MAKARWQLTARHGGGYQYRHAATDRQRLAASTGTQDHRWDLFSDPALSALVFTPAAWPVVLELTRNQPMIRLGIGLHDAPLSGGGGMLHCNRDRGPAPPPAAPPWQATMLSVAGPP